MDCQTPRCYMSVKHLKAVTTIVKEIFDEIVMINLFNLIQISQSKSNITTGLADPTLLYVCNMYNVCDTSESCNYYLKNQS